MAFYLSKLRDRLLVWVRLELQVQKEFEPGLSNYFCVYTSKCYFCTGAAQGWGASLWRIQTQNTQTEETASKNHFPWARCFCLCFCCSIQCAPWIGTTLKRSLESLTLRDCSAEHLKITHVYICRFKFCIMSQSTFYDMLFFVNA